MHDPPAGRLEQDAREGQELVCQELVCEQLSAPHDVLVTERSAVGVGLGAAPHHQQSSHPLAPHLTHTPLPAATHMQPPAYDYLHEEQGAQKAGDVHLQGLLSRGEARQACRRW